MPSKVTVWRPELTGRLADKLIGLHQGSGRTVMRGGWVIDGTQRERARADVVIDAQRVVRVGCASNSELEGATVFDCDGMTIIPGLIDAHVHYGGETTSDPYRRYLWPDDRVRTLNAALSAYKTLEAGFTTVRDVGLTGAGYALRFAINSGLLLGPRILTAGPSISPTGGHGDWHALPYALVCDQRPRSVIADGAIECQRAVRTIHREGADLIKIFVSTGILTTKQDWPPMPAYSIDEIRAMVSEAHMREMRVAAHAMGVESVRRALLGGVDTIEHGLMFPDEDAEEVLRLLEERRVTLVPTLSVYYHTITDGRRFSIFEEGLDRARKNAVYGNELVREAARRGIPIALGTDISSRAGVGDNAREMILLRDAGLPPMEALRSGTAIAARALGIERDLGTLEPGKLADMLLLDADPIEDLEVLVSQEHVRRIVKCADPISRRWEP